LALEVTGTPPLKIEYSRRKDGNNHDFHFQSLQPDGYSSPLIGASNALKTPSDVDVAWVQPARVMVSLNESMDSPGEWTYSVDKVYDAFGNMMTYNDGTDEQERKSRASGLELTHTFHVKERPRAFMSGCDLRSPLKVAKGKHANLPIRSVTEGSSDSAYTVEWVFSPIDSLTNSGDHGDVVLLREFTAKNGTEQPRVSEPGLYTLKTISSGSCAGEIDEPSSCLLLNPLEPHMSLRYEEIPDKCAGNSIGLRVDLDLVGTPPFNVRYDVISGGRVTKEMARINGLRQQLELIPKTDGHHKYVFKSISDAVYHDLPLAQSDNMALEQVVKPAASAQITSNRAISACLDAQVEVDVVLGGDAPWTLEWEIVHDGRRKTEKATNIEDNRFKIKTAPLVKGGEYVLALSSVQDKRGCKTFLQDQMKVSVRRQRPRGGFGLVDGKRSLMSVADFQNRVPLKLSGEGPWMVSYRNVDEGDAITTKKIDGANGYVVLNKRGQYEITSVTDKQCAGDVDTAASTFSLDWHPRPQLSLVENESFKPGSTGVFEKGDVCEGDVDGFEVQLSGQYKAMHFQPTILTCSQVHRRSMSSMRSSTNLCMALMRSAVGSLMLCSPRLLSLWTPAKLETMPTYSLAWATPFTTLIPRPNLLRSSSVSTLDQPPRSPSQVRLSSTVWKSRPKRTRSRSPCRAPHLSTLRSRSSTTVVPLLKHTAFPRLTASHGASRCHASI
jgi:nucleoporin POM152